jgi:excisionase family DNA binding protein
MSLFYPQVDSSGYVLEKHISVKAAAKFSGYNIQYLRRLLRAGRLEGIKIGQVWLIRLASLEAYLRNGQMVRDRRHGPRGSIAESGREATR